MKKVGLMAVMVIMVVVLAWATVLADSGKLPKSLANYFPPKAPGPVWLFKMLGMEQSFTAVFVNLQTKDFKNVQPNFEKFKAKYIELSKMVPEWTNNFPMGPVEQLGRAIKSGDPAKVGAAAGAIGGVCGKCHAENMVRVQAVYHWPSFEAVKIKDPRTQKKLGMAEFMRGLAGSFGGIGIELSEGQPKSAMGMYQGFKANYTALKGMCKSCHDTERTYFVDKTVDGMVDALGAALKRGDAKAVQQISGGIGNENCFKCHLVHLPAFFAQKAEMED